MWITAYAIELFILGEFIHSRYLESLVLRRISGNKAAGSLVPWLASCDAAAGFVRHSKDESDMWWLPLTNRQAHIQEPFPTHWYIAQSLEQYSLLSAKHFFGVFTAVAEQRLRRLYLKECSNGRDCYRSFQENLLWHKITSQLYLPVIQPIYTSM